MKINKSLPEFLSLQGCSEFLLLIKIQNTSISQATKHIFDRTPNISRVLPLSSEQFFYSAEVLLSTAPQKHTSEHLFYSTAAIDCFRL